MPFKYLKTLSGIPLSRLNTDGIFIQMSSFSVFVFLFMYFCQKFHFLLHLSLGILYYKLSVLLMCNPWKVLSFIYCVVFPCALFLQQPMKSKLEGKTPQTNQRWLKQQETSYCAFRNCMLMSSTGG